MTVERSSSDAECQGLLPASIPAMVSTSRSIPANAACIGGFGDGTGHVALGERDADGHFGYQACAADATPGGFFFAQHLTPLLSQASGYHSLTAFGRDQSTGAVHLAHEVIGPDGTMLATTPIAIPGTTAYFFDLSVDPGGGSLFVLKLAGAGADPVAGVFAERFAADGSTSAPAKLRLGGWSGPANPAFAVGGVSTLGDGLVLWNRGPLRELVWIAGSGELTSSIFDDDPFTVQPSGSGATPSYRLAPLLDGSIVLQEAGQWTRRYAHRATSGAPAPDWLVTRPGTALRFTRGNRGYALMPAPRTTVAPCEQRVEIFAPSGLHCGTVAFREGDASCTTGTIDEAWDGTVVQQSARDGCSGTSCTCSHRWWPGLLAAP